jgi:hypothetical protein
MRHCKGITVQPASTNNSGTPGIGFWLWVWSLIYFVKNWE